MARNLMLCFALCLLPAIVVARFAGKPYTVIGYAYCDTCKCGYENEATEPMPYAIVGLECRDKDTGKVTYSSQTKADSNGHYTFKVYGDRGEDCCDAYLIKSSNAECSIPNKGRDRARVILTSNNGMTSKTRYANAMGFERTTPLANCQQVLQKYQLTEDEI